MGGPGPEPGFGGPGGAARRDWMGRGRRGWGLPVLPGPGLSRCRAVIMEPPDARAGDHRAPRLLALALLLGAHPGRAGDTQLGDGDPGKREEDMGGAGSKIWGGIWEYSGLEGGSPQDTPSAQAPGNGDPLRCQPLPTQEHPPPVLSRPPHTPLLLQTRVLPAFQPPLQGSLSQVCKGLLTDFGAGKQWGALTYGGPPARFRII